MDNLKIDTDASSSEGRVGGKIYFKVGTVEFLQGIGEAGVLSFLQIHYHQGYRATCQQFIDDTAKLALRTALNAMARSERFEDFHLVAGKELYIVGAAYTEN